MPVVPLKLGESEQAFAHQSDEPTIDSASSFAWLAPKSAQCRSSGVLLDDQPDANKVSEGS